MSTCISATESATASARESGCDCNSMNRATIVSPSIQSRPKILGSIPTLSGAVSTPSTSSASSSSASTTGSAEASGALPPDSARARPYANTDSRIPPGASTSMESEVR